MYVQLNLATRPLVSHRRFLVLAGLLGTLGLLLLVILGVRFVQLRRAEENLRARSQKIQQQMDALLQQRKELEQFFAQQESAGFRDRAKFAATALQARSINWTQMFMDLEHILPAGVRVFRIEPKLDKGTVSVHFIVGAVSQEAKLKLLKAFEGSTTFSRIELISEKTASDPSTDPLTIEFSADYSSVGI